MHLTHKLFFSVILTALLCVLLATSASAFTNVGSFPIEPGDRIEVTVGADQSASFTYTPTRNMRCNIYQDCDQYMALIHIAPFHMDSAQQHWSDDSPRKGIFFSMKAGVEYTMEVAFPAHFAGGTFTVYFDLAKDLPDNYFSSGASWDAVGNPEPDTTPEPAPTPEPTPAPTPEPVKITVVSPPSTLYYFGVDEYGEQTPDGPYVFSPSNYNLYEGLSFEVLYDDGSTETVTWDMLEWPEGTEYTPEGVASFYKGRSLIVLPYFDGQFHYFPSMEAPGPIPFRVDYGGLTDSFTIELLPSQEPPSDNGNEKTEESAQNQPLRFHDMLELPASHISTAAEQEGPLSFEREGLDLSLDSAILSSIAQQLAPDESLTVRATVSGAETLNDAQKESMKDRLVSVVVDVQLLCGDRSIHQLGGSATLHIPCAWEDGVEYEVYYLAEDGTAQLIPSFRDGGAIAFVTDHFSVYAVVQRSLAAPEPTPTPEPTPEPIPSAAPSAPTVDIPFPLILIIGAVSIGTIIGILMKKRLAKKH